MVDESKMLVLVGNKYHPGVTYSIVALNFLDTGRPSILDTFYTPEEIVGELKRLAKGDEPLYGIKDVRRMLLGYDSSEFIDEGGRAIPKDEFIRMYNRGGYLRTRIRHVKRKRDKFGLTEFIADVGGPTLSSLEFRKLMEAGTGKAYYDGFELEEVISEHFRPDNISETYETGCEMVRSFWDSPTFYVRMNMDPHERAKCVIANLLMLTGEYRGMPRRTFRQAMGRADGVLEENPSLLERIESTIAEVRCRKELFSEVVPKGRGETMESWQKFMNIDSALCEMNADDLRPAFIAFQYACQADQEDEFRDSLFLAMASGTVKEWANEIILEKYVGAIGGGNYEGICRYQASK